MYLNTRNPRSIAKRLRTLDSQLATLQGTNLHRSREIRELEQRALQAILSRWVLIFAVGDDPPMLYDSVTCPRRNVVRGCRTRKEPPVTIAYLPHS